MSYGLELSLAEVDNLLENLDFFSEVEQIDILRIVEELEQRSMAKLCRESLLAFVLKVDPDYKVGVHHKQLADMFEDMAFSRKRPDDSGRMRDRITVNIAPRFGKSQLTSIYFPAWFIGNFPDKKIMMISHTADLAVDFGRKVRNVVDTELYHSIFPGVTLAADSKSAGRWNTNKGGEYFAVGVGGAIAGRGADLMVIDDPHNEQDVLAGNFEVFEKAYNWYAFGARTRLMPHGRVAVVMCMTGDTPVLMADGSEKVLEEIRPGDAVVSYDKENNRFVASKILNHQCSGSDFVYEIRTTCGTVIRANERHPFLVDCDGELIWIRLRDLNRGDLLVSLKDASVPEEPKQNLQSAARANQALHGTENTLTPHTSLSDIMANGKGLNAPQKAATSQHTLKGDARSTTTSISGQLTRLLKRLSHGVSAALNTGTGLRLMTTIECTLRRMGSALCVTNHPGIMFVLTGVESSASITATTQEKCAPCSAMTATSRSDIKTRQKPLPEPLHTYDVSRVEILGIAPRGDELVYDMEVENTGNFIANGIVSHNTRWAKNDLTGKLIEDMTKNPEADQWEVVEFPALVRGKSLWPEQWTTESLNRTKASMPNFQWSAQYMQQPTAAESAIIKKHWWRKWKEEKPPECTFIIQSLDTAAEKNNRADFTSLTTWGVFELDDKETGKKTTNIIILDAVKDRIEYPELKKLSLRKYEEYDADWFIVEKKNSGVVLYQEMRANGLPVQEFTPTRATGDKTARLNSISDIFASGLVWYPEGRRWAEEVVEEVCGFPAMPHDDHVDTTIMALMRFRSGGFIVLPSDKVWDDDSFIPRKANYY